MREPSEDVPKKATSPPAKCDCEEFWRDDSAALHHRQGLFDQSLGEQLDGKVVGPVGMVHEVKSSASFFAREPKADSCLKISHANASCQ
jgi:hypothetical protein